MRQRITSIIAVAVALAASCPAQIQNGDFEQNPPGVAGWLQVGNVMATPAGAQGSANSARVGPSDGVVLQSGAYVGSTIWQAFDDASSTTGPCVIEFDYRALAGISAYIEVSGAAGVHGAYLSPVLLFDHVYVSYPAAGRVEVSLSVTGQGTTGVVGLFQVDNVVCTSGQMPTGSAVPLQTGWLQGASLTPLEQAMLELRQQRSSSSGFATSPAGYLGADGDGMHGHILFSMPWVTWQQVDSTHQGSGIQNVGSLAFRRDFATPAGSAYVARQLDVEIVMAHSDVQNMSAVATDNYLDPPVVVFTKKQVNAPDWTAAPTGVAVEPWSISMPFDRPWPYNGTDDLLWELRITSNSGAPYTRFINYPVDMQSASGSFDPASQLGISIGIGCVTQGQGTGNFTLTQTVYNHRTKLSIESGVVAAPANTPVTLYLGVNDPGASVGFLCATLHAFPLLTPSLGVADANGTISRVLWDNLPHQAALVGLAFHTQAMAIDITQPVLPISLSNGQKLVVPPDPVYPGVGHLYDFRDAAGGPVFTAGPYSGGVVGRLGF